MIMVRKIEMSGSEVEGGHNFIFLIIDGMQNWCRDFSFFIEGVRMIGIFVFCKFNHNNTYNIDKMLW